MPGTTKEYHGSKNLWSMEGAGGIPGRHRAAVHMHVHGQRSVAGQLRAPKFVYGPRGQD